MGKQEFDNRDPHTYRITTTSSHQKEVVAAYHQHEDNGFIVFKDNAHAAVYTIAASTVETIERLSTGILLGIGTDELRLVIASLREHATRLDSVPSDSDTLLDVKRMDALADSLDRLGPLAASRAAEDPSSMPRVPQSANA